MLDPSQIPPGLPANVVTALKSRRANLLTQKRELVTDLGKFNEAVAKLIPEEEVDTYRQWQGRIVSQAQKYREGTGQFAQELAEWEQTVEQAVEHAQDSLIDVVADSLLTIPQARLDKMHKAMQEGVSAELQRAATLLAGETDPSRRERLHAAYKLLNQQKQALAEVQALMTNLRQAQATKDLADLAEMPEKEKLAAGVQQLLSAAGDEGLQNSLQTEFGFHFPVLTSLGEAVGYYRCGKQVVDAAYDVTAVSVSWARIGHVNRVTDSYLEGVNRLSDRMESIVGQIKDIQRQMER